MSHKYQALARSSTGAEIYELLTLSVRSTWLDVGLVLLLRVFRLDRVDP